MCKDFEGRWFVRMPPGRKRGSGGRPSAKSKAAAAKAAAKAEAEALAARQQHRDDISPSPSPSPPPTTSFTIDEPLPKSPTIGKPSFANSVPPITPLKMTISQMPTAPGTPGTPGTPGPFPVPQTPLGSAPPMMAAPGSSSAFETDLPMELLNQGWRKFWSRRENRPYFFNRVSGDTMWEMPPIFNHHPSHNSLSDPLGINQNGPGNFNGPPQHVHLPQQVAPQHHNPHLVHQPHLQQQGQVPACHASVNSKTLYV